MDINQSLLEDIFLMGDMKESSSGDLQSVYGVANMQQALFHRLITVPGSLVHKPLYGIGVGRFQNAPQSLAVQQNIASLIQDQFPQDPRVQSVSGVSITSEDGTPEMTVIAVTLTIVGYTEQTMNFSPFNTGII
jgi:phage baseplate assembly protein W